VGVRRFRATGRLKDDPIETKVKNGRNRRKRDMRRIGAQGSHSSPPRVDPSTATRPCAERSLSPAIKIGGLSAAATEGSVLGKDEPEVWSRKNLVNGSSYPCARG
jgi:hypothetical protein